MQVLILKNQAVLADKCFVAKRFFTRLRGLIGRRDFGPGHGMLFPKNNSIHMWFMGFPIDVVFLKKAQVREDGTQVYRVSSLRENLQPWRLLPVADFSATETLELPAGSIRQHALENGDELICIN